MTLNLKLTRYTNTALLDTILVRSVTIVSQTNVNQRA